jgi:hypothetical protein
MKHNYTGKLFNIYLKCKVNQMSCIFIFYIWKLYFCLSPKTCASDHQVILHSNSLMCKQLQVYLLEMCGMNLKVLCSVKAFGALAFCLLIPYIQRCSKCQDCLQGAEWCAPGDHRADVGE